MHDHEPDHPEPGDPQLEQLLEPVLSASGDSQRLRLDELCAERPDQAAQLRRHFAILEHLGLVDDEAPPIATALGEADPERVGPYRIQRRLGRGGMGVVYLADDEKLGRQVALKLIRREFLASQRARERFRREVAAAAKLNDPGLCTVYEAGEFDGQPFLAMRYLRGTSLAQQLREARASNHGVWTTDPSREGSDSTAARLRALDLRPALQLIERLARAVHTAHEAALVHRDIKPANVMVSPDGKPVLMDFGLALVTDSELDSLTQSQDQIGTPAYMAAEQVRGDASDRRTDVHALGVLLYECLALRLPYQGRNREELYRAILAGAPLDVRQLQPAASRDLATVVHKAMAREPHRRYPTALALAEELRCVIEGRPTAARPPGAVAQIAAWARRNRAAAAVLATVAIGLTSSLLLLVRSLQAERSTEAIVDVLRARTADSNPELAFESLREALTVSEEPEVIGAVNAMFAELQDWQLVRKTLGRVESVTRSPSGRWFVVGVREAPLAIHDASGALLCELPTELFPQVPAIAFSPDESEMLYACRVQGAEGAHVAIHRYRLGADPAEARQFGKARARGMVTSIAWSAHGVVAITRGARKVVARQFDAETEAPLHEKPIPLPAMSRGCAFLPDGRLVLIDGIYKPDGSKDQDFAVREAGNWPAWGGKVLVLGDEANRVAIVSTMGVQVFDLDGGLVLQRSREVDRIGQGLMGASASADGALLLDFQDGQSWLIDPDGDTRVWQYPHSSRGGHFSPDGQRILAGYWDGMVTIRNRRGELLHHWHGHRLGAFTAWMGSGERVLSGAWDRLVKTWTPGLVPGLPHRSGLPRAAVHRAGARLVLAPSDGRLLALDPQGRVVVENELPRAGAALLHRHLDPNSIWIGGTHDASLHAWNLATNSLGPAVRFDDRDNWPRAVAHLASGTMLGAFGWSTKLARLDLATLQGERVGLRASRVAASTDGKRAVSNTGLGRLRVHGEAGRVARRLIDPAIENGDQVSEATCLALSDDGLFALVGRDDGSVTLIDIEQCTHRVWQHHQGTVRALAISPNGSHFASATTAGHLVIRAVDDEKPCLEWHLDGETLNSLTFFGPDALVSGGTKNSGRVRWWWWDPDVLREKVEAVRRAHRERR